MQITIYKKLEGPFAKIEADYYLSKDLTHRYKVSDLADWKKVDLYFILGIDNLRDEDLSDEILHKQHRKQIMAYHPEKKKIDRLYFLTVQKAYEVLKNPVTKMKYDSVFFDESIPEDRVYTDSEFFAEFGKVFRRNAKFSNTRPVPNLGDATSTKEEVEAFYKFWKSFDSWRRFEYTDDIDYENMNSHERRYHEKKSRSNRDKLKKEDVLRVKKLVDTAVKRDPRVRQIKANGLNKSMEDLQISINRNLLTNNWTESDILLLNGLMNKYRKGPKYEIDKIMPAFNKETAKKRNLREFIVKCNEISRLGIKN